MSQRADLTMHIDRLVLRGFSYGDALRVRDAFTRALEQHLNDSVDARRSINAQSDNRRSLPRLTGSTPQAIGCRAAAAIVESLIE